MLYIPVLNSNLCTPMPILSTVCTYNLNPFNVKYHYYYIFKLHYSDTFARS